MKAKSIEQYANQIHDILELEDNFDIRKVVEGLGGVLEEVCLNSGIISQISNLSNKKNNPNFIIQISNLITSEEKIRFLVAHELGHLFIHLGFLDKEKWGESCKSSIIQYVEKISIGIKETEANTFAVAFLMPKYRFKRVADNNLDVKGYDIKKIAKEFNVLYDTAYYRGLNLGIWC